MFTLQEVYSLLTSDIVSSVTLKCNQFLLEERLRVAHDTYFSTEEIKVLNYVSSLVMGGIATANQDALEEWKDISRTAADFEYAMFLLRSAEAHPFKHLRRACILYEIAQVPGVSAALANSPGFKGVIKSFFTRDRSSNFGKFELHKSKSIQAQNTLKVKEGYLKEDIQIEGVGGDTSSIVLDGILNLLGQYMQHNERKTLVDIDLATKLFYEASINYDLELSADELSVFIKGMVVREASSTARFVDPLILAKAKSAGLPSELWPMQQLALNDGVLDFAYQSWGLSAPTGTGKTSIAQLILISFFEKFPDKKAFYIVPSRALASQVANDLLEVFAPLGKKVGALGSHLTYNELVLGNPEEMDLLIFTPEKADLLLRIDPNLLSQTRVVIVDEAHHIEAGTRGILLEFYLWRLRNLVPSECEIIQLSAVAPNIDEMVNWLGRKELTSHVKHDWRTGKFRIGIYERDKYARGVISFTDCQPVAILEQGMVDSDPQISLAQLAVTLARAGVVLVLVSSKTRAEEMANLVTEMRIRAQHNATDITNEFVLECLDARLERELYADIPLRENIKYGVAYHHAGLPPRVRVSIESAIKEKKVDIIFATTTLAEGVNFPFSTVIVESLVIGNNSTLSPRGLWNIAGRAGRFGVDLEGHCIIFRPSIWINKLKGYKFKDYLNNKLDGIPPVTSAFATSISYLELLLHQKKLSYSDLDKLSLQEGLSSLGRDDKKVIAGLINMMRVGLTHAHANNLTDVRNLDRSSFADNLFATSKLNSELRDVVLKVEQGQRRVIRDSLISNERLLNIAAKVGWTIETQSMLVDWIRGLKDWEIERYGKSVLYGKVDSRYNLNSLLFPIADRMTEFEGTKLGGFTAYVASSWIEGHPLTVIRERSRQRNFGSLIDVIYSRIQYLLPWALFGVSELMEYEARSRNIFFGSGVKDLSILSSEGVPNFDSLNLVLSLNIERVDATRLANSYSRKRRETDIIGWFKGLSWQTVAGIVSGSDRRRIDPELKSIHENLQKS